VEIGGCWTALSFKFFSGSWAAEKDLEIKYNLAVYI
jgi:hypothetical protein